MTWMAQYVRSAAKTDQFQNTSHHAATLAAGLMGEAGSILSEVKKERRERKAYPAFRERMLEELGDFLWYYVRLVGLVDPTFLSQLRRISTRAPRSTSSTLSHALDFGSRAGEVLAAFQGTTEPRPQDLRAILLRVWESLSAFSIKEGISLRHAAKANLSKIESRWPSIRTYHPLFDTKFREEEQLPRELTIEMFERKRNVVVLRCNGINFGDRITDNVKKADDYRFHDIFHFSHAVHLGWSPVIRHLLSCKRKSKPRIDEAEDGARARILEEAIAATVFARAKQLKFFRGLDHVDYDLLKTIGVFIREHEVGCIPLWQWEEAILDAYRVFRELRRYRGGTIALNLKRHELTYTPPRRHSRKRRAT